MSHPSHGVASDARNASNASSPSTLSELTTSREPNTAASTLTLHIPDVVVITGMSGSGRTQALHVFEDMGYYCIDNLPPRLILSLAQVVGINTGASRHLAVTCDLRSQGLFDELLDALDQLKVASFSVQVLFLDCADDILIRRYSETRRRHPLAHAGEHITHALARERKQLEGVRSRADLIIDTSHLRTQALRTLIHTHYSDKSEIQLLGVNVFSFGFKYGAPIEADVVIDVRFLPNPFYDPVMRTLTGKDPQVANFVLHNEVTKRFMVAWFNLLDVVMPGYIAEGKTQLSIGIGCTGGQHRSVAIAEKTAEYLSTKQYNVVVSHRDLHLAGNARTHTDEQH